MNIERRISDFAALGRIFGELALEKLSDDTLALAGTDWAKDMNSRIGNARHFNAWFTAENIRKAMQGLAFMLEKEKLEKWISNYPALRNEPEKPVSVGIVMAGNIPLVGFHDLLSVLISGHRAVVRMSSSDNQIWPAVFELLFLINPGYRELVSVTEGQLRDFEAVIATGSNNTSRYFEYYFGKYPHIIRKNRNGIAIIKGDESDEQLKALGEDIFSFFGLGCRNVSKIYIPGNYDLDNIFRNIYDFHPIINHNSYANNFDYNRSVMLLNDDDILENGFVIFKPSPDIASPLACVFYERYDDYGRLRDELRLRRDEIQCIVSQDDVPFGMSQKPELWDYADGVDTIAFLLSLGKRKS